jgi:hypothetical protein
VTLDAGVNPIINGTSSSSTFIISPQTYTEITSLDNKWYIIYNVLTNPLDVYGVFSSTFVANNSTPYLASTGNGSLYIAFFPYLPVLRVPNFLFVTLNWLAGTTTGNFILEAEAVGGYVNVATLSILMTSSPSTAIFTVPITNFPAAVDNLRLRWRGTSGSNDKFGLTFVRII